MAEGRDWREAAAAELRQKIADELNLIGTFGEQIRILQASRDAAAKRVLDINLAAQAIGLDLGPQATVEPPSDQPPHEGGAPATARDITLAELAENPGMKSAELRVAIERRLGRQIHYKTPGMTLYRLAEEGLVQREGHRWFLKPNKEALLAELDLL